MPDSEKKLFNSDITHEDEQSSKDALLDFIDKRFEDTEEMGIPKETEEELISKFPNRLEELSVLKDFSSFVYDQLSRDIEGEVHPEEKGDLKKLVDIVEYQALLIHFIKQIKDPDYLKKLWQYFEKVITHISYYEQNEESEEKVRRYLPILKTGILGQVALERLFENTNIPTHTSKPTEDAYKRIDFWIQKDEKPVALQIKTSRRYRNLEIIKDRSEMPALSVSMQGRGKSERIFFNKLFEDANRFRVRVKQYAQELGHPIDAYLVLIPSEEVDAVTGEPSESLKKQFQAKIAEMLP